MSLNDEEYNDWQSGELRVVKNIEGFCSIWPVDRELPKGWDEIGFKGKKEDCLKKIEAVCDRNCKFIEK